MAFSKNDYSASMQDVFALRLEMMNQIKALQDAIAAGGGGGGIDPSGIKLYTLSDQKTSNGFSSTAHSAIYYTTSGPLQPKTLYLVAAKAQLSITVNNNYDAVIYMAGTFSGSNAGTIVYGGPHNVNETIRLTAPSLSSASYTKEFERVFTMQTGDFDPVPDPDDNPNPGLFNVSFKLYGNLFGEPTSLSSTHGGWAWRYAPAVVIPIATL